MGFLRAHGFHSGVWGESHRMSLYPGYLEVFGVSPIGWHYILATSLPSVASISVSAPLSCGPGSSIIKLKDLCEPGLRSLPIRFTNIVSHIFF